MAHLLIAVNEALSVIDPEGLLELGAPVDEYSSEAQEITSQIAALLADDLTLESITGVIRDVWVRAFGPFSNEDIIKRMPVFRQVAGRILSHDQIS